MTYPLATEQDLLGMLVEVDRLIALMDSAVIVNQERWENLRQTRLDERERILEDLARVRTAA